MSVGDLMKAADLTHGSFYNHFESKQGLVSECIDYLNPVAVGRIGAAKPTEAGKRAFVRKYLSFASRDKPGQVCLMSTLGSEIAREPAARTAMTDHVRAFVGQLASHFPWPRPAVARRDAIRMTASLVGAVVLARAVDDETFSKEILREVIGQFSEDGPDVRKPRHAAC